LISTDVFASNHFLRTSPRSARIKHTLIDVSIVAAPCRDAMQEASDEFGCCWETIMEGYSTRKLYSPNRKGNWILVLHGSVLVLVCVEG
jgi:hypothetical protein